MSLTRLNEVLTALERIDWDNTGSILAGATPVFDLVAGNSVVLAGLLDNLQRDAHLQAMCERYDFLDKLVLADIPRSGIRIRLHLYRAGYYDRPHNHRWSFASRIMRGQYVHRIFGQDSDFTPDTDPSTLRPIHERVESSGAAYALHHTSIHTVQAEEGTVSLLIRGPAAKERFLILDRAAGGSFWAYGAATETPQQQAAKRMTTPVLLSAVGRAREMSAPSP